MSDNREVPYIIVEKDSIGIGAFILGAVVGAAAALLLAPKSGSETQAELKESARRLKDQAEERLTELRQNVGEGYDKLRADVTERVDEAREELVERKSHAEEALRIGKEAARKAREDLEKRVAETKAAYRAKADKAGNGSAEASS